MTRFHLLALALMAALLAQAVPTLTSAGAVRSASGISIHVEVGWGDQYRGEPAWAPVRVVARNSGGTTVAGSIQFVDASIAAAVEEDRSADAEYRASVVLPPGAVKHVTLYVPGADLLSVFDVRLTGSGHVLAQDTAYPTRLADGDLSIGALSSDPSNLAWLGSIDLARTHTHVADLSPDTFDALPEVLATFDLIVLDDIDSSQLDRAQLLALDRYVRDGGSLLMIGGPDAQETIGPLPHDLVPGRLSRSLAFSNLAFLAPGIPRQPAALSVLRVSSGITTAIRHGVSVVVHAPLGSGTVEYLAFDPSLAPLAGWRGSPAALTPLIVPYMPRAVQRLSLPTGSSTSSFLDAPPGPLDMAQELAVGGRVPLLPVAAFVVLTLLYLAILGPLNVAAVRRFHVKGRMWSSVPVLAVALTLLTQVLAPHLAGMAPTIDEVGIVRMDGPGDLFPATVYLSAPATAREGSQLSYDGQGLPAPVIPQLAPGAGSTTIGHGWTLDEGAVTTVRFGPDSNPVNRSVQIRTQLRVPGSLGGTLEMTADGDLVGRIANNTPLTLRDPSVVAGRAVRRLPDIAPWSAATVRIQPQNDIQNHTYDSIAYRVYGHVPLNAPTANLAAEVTLAGRERAAISALPEASVLSTASEVYLMAWIDRPLDAVKLDGSAAVRRSLLLIQRPLSLTVHPGPFSLRTGTLGAQLLDETPSRPRYACCQSTPDPVYLGRGGVADFAFSLPHAHRIHLRTLTLWAYGGGSDTSYTDYTDMPNGAALIFDWKDQRWTALAFRDGRAAVPRPSSSVSSTGIILIRLHVRDASQELTIADAHQDLQLAGAGIVS